MDATRLGFQFTDFHEMTYRVECLELDGQPGTDAVLVVNKLMQDSFYIRRSMIEGPSP